MRHQPKRHRAMQYLKNVLLNALPDVLLLLALTLILSRCTGL